MAAVKQDLTVAIKLNDQFSGGLKDIQRETANTFDEGKSGSFLGGIKASTVALGAMAVGGLAAVGSGLKASFDLAREFEQSMADVSAITGATGTELQSLSDLARDMGAVTAHSATSAAEGIQFLGMAGFDTNQIMDALPATLNLASAAGMELGAAADISSNILSGMGMNAGDLDGVVDKLAQTSRNANTDVGQLGEAFKMVGPTAGAAGMSFDDTTVSLGLLANAGLQGGIGGSSLNSALRSMISPSKEAAKEAEKLGLTFMDTNGKMLPMSNIMTQLEEKSVSTKQSFKIFGTEGARAINALRAQGVEAFTKLDKKIKESGGVAQDMADTRLGSFDGAMTKLSSAMSEFGISVGETFLPIVSKIVSDFLIPAVAQTNEFIKSFGGLDTMFRDALTFIVGFKNTALNILSELFNNTSFAADFLGNLGSVFLAAQKMQYTFAFGTSGNGGMVGIMIELAKVVWAPLEAGFLIIWDAIKIPLVNGINFMQQMFTAGINGIIRSFNSLASVIGVSIDEIDFTPLTVDAPKTAAKRWAESGADISTALDTVGDHMTDMKDGLAADLDNVTTGMRKTAQTAAHLVDKGMKEVVEKYDGATETMKAEAPADGKAIGEGLAKPIVKAMDDAGEVIAGDLMGSIGRELKDPQTGIGKILTGGLAEAISTGDFKGAISGVATGLGTMIAGPIGGAIAGKIAGAIFDSGPSAASRAEGALGSILQGFEGAGGDVSKMGGLVGDLGGIFDAKTGKVKEGNAYFRLIQKLQDFGVNKEASVDLLNNIIPKMRQGRELGAGEVRRVNEALKKALIDAEVEDIRKSERVERFEKTVTGSAEDILADENAAAGRYYNDRGELVDINGEPIAAANGYSGMVSEPTLFLAGEAGPEMVDITPTSRMSGGFSGSGGSNFHFNFSVSTIDEQGVRSFIEQDAKPFIVQMLNRESTRGSTVMYSTGLTTDPSV
jgi:TP901 family phage tail tape measure protein